MPLVEVEVAGIFLGDVVLVAIVFKPANTRNPDSRDSALGISAAEFRDWWRSISETGQSACNIFQVMDVLNPNVRDEANDNAHRLFFTT